MIWHQGDSIQPTQATHLLYNIFIAVLACWRVPNNLPFSTIVTTSTQRYNNIEIEIVPGSGRVAEFFTPVLAGALLWRMLLKCLVVEPTYWTASLVTRSRTPQTVGLVRTEARIGSLSTSKLDPTLSASLTNETAEEVSSNSNQTSNITSAQDISEHVHFQGPLGVVNPADGWLTSFLLWSSEIITAKSALTDVAITFNPDIIWQTQFPMTVGGSALVFQAKAGDRPPGSSFTYDEFFRGIQDILEIVIATSQYQLLDAKIYKDEWLAATFRVFLERAPESSRKSVAIE